jgi:choline-glycine betaine transporter
MMRFLAPEMIGHPMDIAAVVGAFTGLGTSAGVVMHFLLGTLGFAIGFVIVGPYLPGPG